MSFNQKEDLRCRMSDLEKRLAESEEERFKLEKMCNVLMRAFREEEKAQYNNLNRKYEKFLQDCSLRKKRNDIILRSLCRIEDRCRALSSKTERLKFLRDRYISYLKISDVKQGELSLKSLQFSPPSQKTTDDVTPKLVQWKSPLAKIERNFSPPFKPEKTLLEPTPTHEESIEKLKKVLSVVEEFSFEENVANPKKGATVMDHPSTSDSDNEDKQDGQMESEAKSGSKVPMGLDGVDYQNETYPESYYEQPVHHHDHKNIIADVILEEDETELEQESPRSGRSPKSFPESKSEKLVPEKSETKSSLIQMLESDSESFQIEHGDGVSENDDSDFDFSFQ